ncbi:hypothetical protein EV175_000839 [Coemansia sp. RSA 1933]|nr:hypothetical protein EV175_000839 [Coemansia sp. RSA 1933]
MILTRLSFSLLAVALSAGSATAMYDKGSPVKQLTPANFDRVLSRTSQPTFVEFYAPWCGHCKSLEPKYELAAKRTASIAQFYAVNCDDDVSRGLCARFNVQGFPTIKVFSEKRTKHGNRKSVDYQGERSARAMVQYARSVLPNLSIRLSDDALDAFVIGTKLPKAVLLTARTKTGDLWKGISAKFDKQVDFAQISSPSQATLERLGVDKLPAVVAFPDSSKPDYSETYKDEIKHQPLAKFIKRISIGRKEPSEPARKVNPTTFNLEVKEIVSQSDLENLCIDPVSSSAIPILCIVGIMPLEPEFQESRDEHAQALKVLESVSKSQRMRNKYAEHSSSGHRRSNEGGDADDDDTENEERHEEGKLEHPFRVFWANALSASGQNMRKIFGLSDDSPAVVAINPRKGTAAPYMGPFDSTYILEWADACYQGRGMRQVTSNLDIGNKNRGVHNEL